MEYYCTELELNAKFHTFAKNNRIIHRGHNTVQAQMKYKCKRGRLNSIQTTLLMFLSFHDLAMFTL